MPIIKAINESYEQPEDLYRLLQYVYQHGIGYGVNLDLEHAYEQMILVKMLWNKTDKRQCRHFIVSFDLHEFNTIEEIISYGFKIAGFYADQFQIMFAIHINTDHPHIHFVMNSVSYIDGHKYSGGWEDYFSLRQYVSQLNPKWKVAFTQE